MTHRAHSLRVSSRAASWAITASGALKGRQGIAQGEALGLGGTEKNLLQRIGPKGQAAIEDLGGTSHVGSLNRELDD